MKILLIIAAGNSTRMDNLPKAVSLVHGKPNLYNTVEKAYKYYDKIYVSSNNHNYLLYKEVLEDFDDKVQVVSIYSGHGCGHAILNTINKIETDNEFLFRIKHTSVCWGDVYFENEYIFKELVENTDTNPIVIPVVFEKNPYVWFTTYNDTDNRIVNSMFSKRGESAVGGYHDQSIFKIDVHKVAEALSQLNDFMYKRSNLNYLNEIIFLDLVNYFFNIKDPCILYETKYQTKSYNTKEELQLINKK